MGDMTDQTETDRSRAPQAHPAVLHAPRHFAPRWRYYIGMVTVLACMALLFLPCSAYTIEFPGPTGNVLGKVSKAKNAKDMISISGGKTYRSKGKLGQCYRRPGVSGNECAGLVGVVLQAYYRCPAGS